MSRGSERRVVSVEQEPISLKTGLDVIRLALGEERTEWLEMEYGYHKASLILNAVGENLLVGSCRCKDALTFPIDDMKRPEEYLESIGGTKITLEHGGEETSLAKSIKESTKGKHMLLVLNETGYVHGSKYSFYDVPPERLMTLVEQIDKEAPALTWPEVIEKVKYRLEGGIFACEFPPIIPFSYESIDKFFPSEKILVGEGEEVLRDLFEPAMILDKFFEEHQGEIGELFTNWQRRT